MVATKAALSIRVDALTDSDGKSEPQAPSIGIENRAKLESRLRALEQHGDMAGVRRFADNGKKQKPFQMTGETKTYNTQADAVDLVPTQREPMEVAVKAVLDVKEEKRRAKEERRAKRRAEKEKGVQDGVQGVAEDVEMDVSVQEEKKDKKRKRRESEAADGDVDGVVKAKVGQSYLSSLSSMTHHFL
jgi:nucleolar protein 58